jgi:Transmembrane exosortase (Exosortase_EpsH)
MAAVSTDVPGRPPRGIRAWVPVAVGLLAMYVPTAIDVSRKFWVQEDESHGPVILAIVLWLLWRERKALLTAQDRALPFAGWLCFASGLGLYVIGRSQQFFQFDVASLIPVLLCLRFS